jgi:hypothetical protein
MPKQISNKPLPDNAALAASLEYTLTQIRGDMAKALKRGDKTSAHYYREQYAVTKKIIYAIRNDRIARTDADVERLVNDGR